MDTKVVEKYIDFFQKDLYLFHSWMKFEEFISYQSLTDCDVG